MHVLITGATGFVGRALTARLLRDGHAVTALTRSPDRARSRLGSGVTLVDSRPAGALEAAVAGADAVVNLAGENLAEGRWTAQRKEAFVTSRVDLTRRLVDAIAAAPERPQVLVSTSAVGYYGDRGDERLDESSAPGEGFLADLCVAWEREAAAARAQGVRVPLFRVGVVLGAEGGALAKMVPPFRFGAGAKLGSGRQWMPWIHLHDLVELYARALTGPDWDGVFDAVAPGPVTNAELTRQLAAVLGRPALLTVPGFALRAGLGEAAQTVLASQRVVDGRAAALGFSFRYPRLGEALSDLLGPGRAPDIVPDRTRPEGAGRAGQYRLEDVIDVEADRKEVFAFFSDPTNLALLTPEWTDFAFVGEPPAETREGLDIEYRLKVGALPLRWKSRIAVYEAPFRFVDTQLRGPYRSWWHEHRFVVQAGRTRVEDRVWYALPFGPVGRLVHHLFVAPKLRRIFAYRHEAVALRFGAPAPSDGEDAA